ncbi:hypothetical protein POF63_04185 [Streptococcus agalactiae]|uniref:hypothetical protein n=1 Tax=Streptococcus agalactiae TaxID=1311 RepID=UPI0002DE3C00|nr:hypothetical protein [Streptococcus agalactiae]AIX04543.1 glycerophosphoryl diester phosphodiesterase family protein [Streptococcus agalactiae CNCTC 10/84]EPT54819.1 hypothetical protein SAG0053_01945 [Streptococcus agalactiae CCUG 25532]EPV19253.1 hypothetical protein SAG0334_00590 [Streptococcus agalactiae GB00640]EPT85242.1 hypothetical protein SAG0099_00595 [Streptococcus agalactiae BSU247]EPW98539.1 hypothetical protein SAG0147_02855 [Streptococcus agalactiae MRI Z1-048]
MSAVAELVDGTILDKEVELTSEEFRKNPMVIRADHPLNKIFARLTKEKYGLD